MTLNSIARIFRFGWILIGLPATQLIWCGSLQAAGPDLESVKKTLLELKEQGGNPDEHKFLELVYQDSGRLSNDDFWSAWRYLGTIQRPPITIGDLTTLIQTKRESIADYSAQYKVEHSGTPTAMVGEDIKLVFAGNHYYLNIHYRVRPNSPEKVWDVLAAYDGESLRQLYPPDGGRRVGHASITTLDTTSRERFLQTASNPLAVSMLVDSVALCGRPIPIIDLVSFLKDDVVLFEKPVSTGGVECLVASSLLQRVFLDPKRDYAVVRVEDSTLKDRLLRNASTQEFEGLVDHGNGVWLPHRITRTFVDGETGRQKFSSVIAVEKISLNEGVDSKLFTDVIPNGVLVGDTIHKISYVNGDNRSIEEALHGSIPPPNEVSKRSKWWLIAMNAVLVVGFGGYLAMRTLRRDAGSARS